MINIPVKKNLVYDKYTGEREPSICKYIGEIVGFISLGTVNN